MDINEFIVNFANQFDETDPDEIKADTKFHDLAEWSSLTGMGVIAMAKTIYGKTISGREIRECIKDRRYGIYKGNLLLPP